MNRARLLIRTGGPKDDGEDMGQAVWAGVLPMALSPPAPVVDPEAEA